MFYSSYRWVGLLSGLLLFIFCFCLACSSAFQEEKKIASTYSPFPSVDYLYKKPSLKPDGWKIDSVLEENKAEELVSRLMSDTTLGLSGVLLSRNGSLILEEYEAGWPQDTLFSLQDNQMLLIASLSATLEKQEAGIMQQLVKLPTIRYSSPQAMSDTAVSLQHLLQMDTDLLCRPQQQLMRNIAEKSHAAEFYYCPANYEAVADWLEGEVDEPLSFFAEKNLFEPLEIDHYSWDELEIRLSPRDILKLGAIHAQNGWWQQNQVLSASWVLRLKSRAYSKEAQGLFAWGWWQDRLLVNGRQYAIYYSKSSNYLLVFVPDLSASILLTGNLKYSAADYFSILQEQALPAFEKNKAARKGAALF